MDISSLSQSLSINIDDPCTPGGQSSGGLWESVSVNDKILKSWNISSKIQDIVKDRTRYNLSLSIASDGDIVLTIILTVPSHSLLPSLLSPSSHHHTLTITTLPSHNPTLAMEAIFPNKILTHDRGGLTTHRGGLTHDRGGLTHDRGGLTTNRGPLSLSPSVSMKSSIVITPLHIRHADSHHHHKKVTNIYNHQSIYVSINYFLFFVLLITFTFILHGLSLSAIISYRPHQ